MRNQFYADRRDVWKWTTVLAAAEPHRKILYVAMYRPDTAPRRPEGVSPAVWDFFSTEWVELSDHRDYQRITKLDKRIEIVPDVYEYGQRKAYFEKLIRLLENRPNEERHVILLDPDTGIEPTSPSDKHVCYEQISDVWNTMRTGDVLLIYQHNSRKEQHSVREEKRSALARELRCTPERIHVCPYSDVCFFRMTK